MMKPVLWAGWALGVLLTVPGFAEPLTVDYVDGTVETKMGQGAWMELQEGTTISSEAQIRLQTGVAELISGDRRLHLSKDGTYRLEDLLKKKPTASEGLSALASSKMDKLLGAASANRVTVAHGGVRGDNQSNVGALDWSSEEEEPGDVPDAVAVDSQEALVQQARQQFDAGRSAAALATLNKAAIGPADAVYMQAVLLSAAAGLDAQDFPRVLAVTKQALARELEVDLGQTLLLAQGLAYRGLGDEAQASAVLGSVVRLDPTTPIAAEANRLVTP